MHPIFGAALIAFLQMAFMTIKFYRRGDVPRAVFWLVAIVAFAEVARLVR